MTNPFANHAWLDLVQEEIVAPQLRIVDPHHHLWNDHRGRYALAEFHRDTQSGHRIEKTVFVECGANYLERGPEHLRSVGETQFVARLARQSRESDGAVIAGIVGHVDLRLDRERLDEALDCHEAEADGLFRGVRHAGACDPHPEALRIPGRAPSGLYGDDRFRAGLRRLGERGLVYDTWHYHHQNRAFAELARAVPDTTLVLDHFGTPLGVGPYADRREEIFAAWKDDIAELADCANVVAKLGGLAMPDNGFGWHERELPSTSDELVEQQSRYYDHTIRCFGAERCMFESNFPVDKLSISYPVLWNAFKRIAGARDESQLVDLFAGTAERVYRL